MGESGYFLTSMVAKKRTWGLKEINERQRHLAGLGDSYVGHSRYADVHSGKRGSRTHPAAPAPTSVYKANAPTETRAAIPASGGWFTAAVDA